MDENMAKGKRVQRWRKAYNLMQCDQKTRTYGIFFFFFEFEFGFVEKQKLEQGSNPA